MKNNPEEKVDAEKAQEAELLIKELITKIIKKPLECAKGFNTLIVNPRLKEHIKRKDELHIIFFWSLVILELVFVMPLLAAVLCITVLKTIWEIFIGIFIGLTMIVYAIGISISTIGIGISWLIWNILPKKKNKIN